jgi:hypothetical protein
VFGLKSALVHVCTQHHLDAATQCMDSHWGNRDPVAKGGHLKGVNVTKGTRMRMVEFSDEVWYLDIMLFLPGVLFITIALPLDEELQTIPRMQLSRTISTSIPHPREEQVVVGALVVAWGWGCSEQGST